MFYRRSSATFPTKDGEAMMTRSCISCEYSCLLCLLSLAFTCVDASPSPSPFVALIAGGQSSDPHEYPWLMSLGNVEKPTEKASRVDAQKQGEKPQETAEKPRGCGASLIRVKHLPDSSDIALTAAHCVLMLAKSSASSCHGKKELFQVLGVAASAHKLSVKEKEEMEVKAVDGECHEKWTKQKYANDIALIKLEKPIKFTDTVKAIELAKKNNPAKPGQRCTLAGWGGTGFKHSALVVADVLQEVDLIIQNDSYCAKADSLKRYDPETMLCAKSAKSTGSACQGDSGGVLVCDGIVQGVVSFSAGPPGQCTKKATVSVYAKVSAYEEWIEKTIEKLIGK